jgi:hypothetical protein
MSDISQPEKPIEMPTAGGTYNREKDGSLTRIEDNPPEPSQITPAPSKIVDVAVVKIPPEKKGA